MNIENIKRRLYVQTRNGKSKVSVSMEELFELIPNLSKNSLKTSIIMDVDELMYLIEEYEKNNFKTKIKVEEFDLNLEKLDEKEYNIKERER